MRRILLILAAATVFAPLAVSQPEKQTTKVEGSFLLAKELGTFAGRVAEVRLYAFDPFLADKGADLVEKIEFAKFAHTQGKETKKSFVIGAKGTLDPKMRYYLTFFILENGNRTHIGACAHSGKDLCKVLTGGQPAKVEIKVREIRR